MVKNMSANAGGDAGSIPVLKILWRSKWQPTPVFLPGKSHGQRSLVCCSPWGHRVRYNLVTKPPPSYLCLYLPIYPAGSGTLENPG